MGTAWMTEEEWPSFRLPNEEDIMRKEETHPMTGTEYATERGAREEGARIATRERYGGLDIPAGIAGMFAAIGMLALLGALASALLGSIAFQSGTLLADGQEATLTALIVGGVVLFVAFAFGGWTAGRIARYSGALNGAMTAVMFFLLGAILAGLGALIASEFNLFDELQVASASLPNWFSQDTMTTGAIVSAVASILLTLFGGILGGLLGQRWHERADDYLAGRVPSETTRTVVVPPTPAPAPAQRTEVIQEHVVVVDDRASEISDAYGAAAVPRQQSGSPDA